MKISRQAKIIELINKFDIDTQEDLADKLMHDGYNVTQATVSRDIRELKLTKVAMDDGSQKYIVLQKTEQGLSDRYSRVFREGFVSMDRAQNILIIKTISGMAMAVAAALDALEISSIVGCIAGDDTVMCAIRTNEETIKVMEKLSKIIHSVE